MRRPPRASLKARTKRNRTGKRAFCCYQRERERERERERVNEYATRILFTPTPSLKEKRRKRPFDERVKTIEKNRIHVIIINLPQPLLRALRQSRTRSSRVRYSHRRRRRSSSCHFLKQQQPHDRRERKE